MAKINFDINPVNEINQVMHDSDSGSMSKLLDLCLRFGSLMNSVGSESARTEDSIERILAAYGIDSPSAFCIPTIVIISFKDEEGNIYTSSRRMRSQSSNFTKLDELNSLSRYLCNGELKTLSIFESELDRIEEIEYNFNMNNLIGTLLVAFSFNFIFGGDFRNAIGAVLAAFLMAIINNFLTNAQVNSTFNNLASSFFGNVFVELFAMIGLINNTGTASISIIMGLVPGMLLTTSIREVFSKDYTSGLNKLVECLFIAISLAVGAALAIVLLR